MTFEQFIIDQGYEPPCPLHDDGKIHRFPAPDKKRSNRSAWYWYVGEAGVLGDWTNGFKATWIGKVQGGTITKERMKRLRDLSMKRHKDTQTLQQRAKKMAESMWAFAKPGPHLYLERKGPLKCHNTRVLDHRLLVPLYSPAGLDDLVNLQRIYPDGTKRFLKGGMVDGVYSYIGKPSDGLYICEGWATGATIHEVTGNPVVCAMNANNMMHVAIQFRRFKPIIAADNDSETRINGRLFNVGFSAGVNVAKELRLRLTFPAWDEPGTTDVTDFNDLFGVAGKKETTKQLKPMVDYGK